MQHDTSLMERPVQAANLLDVTNLLLTDSEPWTTMYPLRRSKTWLQA